MTRLIFMLVMGDFLLAISAHFVGIYAASVSFSTLSEFPTVEIINALFFACILLLTSSVSELYGKGHYKVGKGALARVIASLLLALAVIGSIYFLAPQIMGAKNATVVSLVFFGFFQFLWHTYYPFLIKFPGMSQNLLILGSGPLAVQVGETLANDNHNYELVGFAQSENENSVLEENQIIGRFNNLVETSSQFNVQKIVVAVSEQRGVLPIGDLLKCRFNGIDVVDAMSFFEEMTGTVQVENVNPGWFIYSSGFEISLFSLYIKRILDIVFSLIGILLSWPVMIVVALAVKLDSPGPVLYRQIRVGKNEEVFELYKFRTMNAGAEQTTGAVWASLDDPRITKVGKFLRKTRLDEIPQFFNVLKGDMAFVGPRPERPEFVLELYQLLPYYTKRHALKSGVTGWAQVNYPYGASVEDALEKLNYDLYYIKNYSIFLDILIIMETVQVVLFGRGGR